MEVRVREQGLSGKLTAWEKFDQEAMRAFGSVNITREQAVLKDLKFYYTGKVCKNGHDTHRFTHNRQCRLCLKTHKFKDENAVKIEEGKARRKVEEWLELMALDKEHY